MPGKKAVLKSRKKEEAVLTERRKVTPEEKIKELEKEISTTKYNKKTQHAIGMMKAKLAMLKQKQIARSSVGKAKGDDRYAVRKTGDGTAVLLGFPSVGKSTLLNKITNAKSDVAAYSFTTLNAVPGILDYKFAKVQIIDVPGIVSGAAAGTGRGKEVLSIIRNADLVIILIDALYPHHYKSILREVYNSGVRINMEKPDVKITKKQRGGVSVGTTVKLTKMTKKTVVDITREMRITNADVLIRTNIDADELIDVIEANRSYTKSLTIITKADLVKEAKLKELVKNIKPDVVVSAEKGTGIEELKEAIFDKMGFIRVFLKEVNKSADMEEPLIMFKGCTIKDVCMKLHRDFVTKFKFARLWGKSAKFDAQVFKKLNKALADEDVLELHMN
ncbi:50S ribosome-binding GTPase [Candidatus Woesearchaeota archaeon]|nr:50S ribosome-binding GTPase [Candidatus Woesearchaeota archaeon]